MISIHSRNNVGRPVSRAIDTVMVWLSAWCVSFSLIVFAAFITTLIFLSANWILEFYSTESVLDSIMAASKAVFLSSAGNADFPPMLPAIVGTSVVVILMSVIVAPLGVIVAVYLSEYARDTWYTELVRVGVQNLAGVPSVIFGVFGLAFFVYTVGGSLDAWLYGDRLPSPTYGTPGLLWSAITLALLTLPTVIVVAEEGLYRVPESLREGSYALGATRAETVLRVVIPAAAPSFFTGIILAVARAAGEVAPLMLVGVVRFAPDLPVSATAPFVNLEQKFMHLGFYIFDISNHAVMGEGRLGLLAVASLLLVLVILSLNVAAIVMRNSLRRRYQTSEAL